MFEVPEGKSKTFLLTLDTCGHCEDFKEVVKDKLESGEITEVPCSQDEGKPDELENLRRVLNNDIEAFPTLIEVEQTDKGVVICEKNLDTGEKEKCRILKTD